MMLYDKNSTSILDVARYTLCSLFAICFFECYNCLAGKLVFR